jgi:hypothetical protein
MAAVSTYIVTVAATVTATAAVGTFHHARAIARRVDENEDRSIKTAEIQRGDPETLPSNLIERIRDLEEEVEA